MTKKNSAKYSNISDERRLQMDDLRSLGYEFSLDDEDDSLTLRGRISDLDMATCWDEYH